MFVYGRIEESIDRFDGDGDLIDTDFEFKAADQTSEIRLDCFSIGITRYSNRSIGYGSASHHNSTIATVHAC